ncbi:MAG: class I SAM-dependent methyltransferase [Solirubrobacteraceae bacterium]
MSDDTAAAEPEPQGGWDRAAEGWGRRRAEFERFARPVAHWLVEAIEPQPGHRLLELAAGVGETGFLAFEIAAPGGGSLTCTDASEHMLTQARSRAAQLGLVDRVEFKLMRAEWIDAELASIDGVLCRFGLMLCEDPAAALREARRVLRPGGRIAAAVWDERARNPHLAVFADVLAERGLAPAPAPRRGEPGPFALSDRALLAELFADAGFASVQTRSIDLVQRAASFDAWWEAHLELSPSARAWLAALPLAAVSDVRNAVRERLESFTAGEDGSLLVPALALAASAEA